MAQRPRQELVPADRREEGQLARADADLGDLLYLIRRYRPAVTDAL